MRSLFACVSGLVASLLLVFQVLAQDLPLSPAQSAWLRDHPTVTVAVYEEGWPPFEEWNRGQPRGLSVDYLNEALERLGVNPDYVLFSSWPEMVQAACEGSVDIVMNISITAERTECMVFTREYIQVPVAIVSRLNDVRPFGSTDLEGLHIVTERGFSTSEAARTRYPLATYMYVDTTLQALQAVSDSTADIYIGNAYVAANIMQVHPVTGIGLIRVSELSTYPLHFAVPNANRPLAESINMAMQAIPQTRRETLELKWLPDLEWVNEDDSIFSPEEQAALNRQLVVGFPPHASPISFAGEQGQPMGLLAEYLQRFQDLGAKLVPFQAKTWQDVRDAMRSSSVDVVVAAFDPLDTSRQWVHSLPIASIPNVIVTRSDSKEGVLELRDLAAKSIALSDPERLKPLISRAARGATFVHATDAAQGLELVRTKEVAAYVGNLAVVDSHIRERFVGELRVVAPAGFDDVFVFSAPKEDALIVSAFDRMLASMSPRERAAIRSDWLAVEYTDGINWRRIASWLLPILAILVVAVLVHARGYRKLRLEVEQRRILEKRFSEVTDNLPSVVYQASLSSPDEVTFPFVVGDLASMFGITAEEAMANGNALLERIDPTDRDRLRGAIREAMAMHREVDVEFQARSSNGWRWIRSNSRPYRSDDQHWHWTGYWIDVTDQHRQWEDLREAKADAEAAARAKADFLATMSHEIRTPMSGVVGLLEMLSHTPLDEEQMRILSTIEDSAQMLRQILDDILDYSKMEAGALSLDASPLSIPDTVYSVLRMLEPLSREKNLDIQTFFDADLAEAHVSDEVRFRQILFNLLSNAIKFTDRGTVNVSVAVREDSVGSQRIALTVADTGIGIDKARQEKLFQPFSQAEPSTARRFGGSGLGLSICQRIVTLMGGTIALVSEPGKGTEVTAEVVLPIGDKAESEVFAPRSTASAQIFAMAKETEVRVLIAEDHPTNRALMAWYMQQLGLSYDIVNDGSQALEALEKDHYDLLITDGLMPVMTGYELAKEIRRREKAMSSARLPIVVVTASVYKREIEPWMESGMDGYLAKPISLDALAKAIHDRLQHRMPVAAYRGASPMPCTSDVSILEQDILPNMIRQYGSLRIAMEMLRSFCETTRGDIERLRAVDETSPDERGTVAHRLAGGLYAIMQPALADQAKALEQSLIPGGDSAGPDVLALVARVETLVKAIEEHLTSSLQSPAS